MGEGWVQIEEIRVYGVNPSLLLSHALTRASHVHEYNIC